MFEKPLCAVEGDLNDQKSPKRDLALLRSRWSNQAGVLGGERTGLKDKEWG